MARAAEIRCPWGEVQTGKERCERSKVRAAGSSSLKEAVQHLSGCIPAWHFSVQSGFVGLQFHSVSIFLYCA